MVTVNTTMLRAFNKAGARLLQKVTKAPIEDNIFYLGDTPFNAGKAAFHGITPPKGAVTGSFVQGEKAFGKEGFEIVSFFDESGKLIQRHNRQLASSQEKPVLSSIANYIWGRNGTGSITTLKSHTSTFQNGKCIAESSRHVLADSCHANATVAQSTLTKNKGIVFTEMGRDKTLFGTKHMADRFETEIKQTGKISNPKKYTRTTFYEPSTGVFMPLKGKGQNLTAEEMAVLDSDTYLPLRIQCNGINPYEYVAKDAFYNQGIPLNTSITYSNAYLDRIGAGGGANKSGVIFRENGHDTSLAVSVANHEARHIKQFEIIRDYQAGKITDPSTIEKARIYQYENNNYITPGRNQDGYRNQLIEREAYDCGNKVLDTQEQLEKRIDKIFPRIRGFIFG